MQPAFPEEEVLKHNMEYISSAGKQVCVFHRSTPKWELHVLSSRLCLIVRHRTLLHTFEDAHYHFNLILYVLFF